ncbi:hypothetical protein JCM1840_007154 [Sporobolomyces johnsonii]
MASQHHRQLTGGSRSPYPAAAPASPSPSSTSTSSLAWRSSSSLNDPPPLSTISTTLSTAFTSPMSSPIAPEDAEEGKAGQIAPFAVPQGVNGYSDSSDSSSSDSLDEKTGKRMSNGEGGAEDEWDEFVTRLKQAGRLWRRTWHKEGWNGILAKLRRTRLSTLSPSSLSSTRLSSPSSLRALLTSVPRRRRFLFLGTLTLIFLFLWVSPSSSPNSPFNRRRGPASRAHDILTSSSNPFAPPPASQRSSQQKSIAQSLSLPHVKSVNKAKVLESVSNPYGFINLIDPYAGGVFNPSVLVLPDAAGLGWRHLLVARGPEKYEVINEEDTRWEKILGCFLLPLKRAHLDLPYMARESELETLNLPAKRKVDYLRCHDPVYDQFIGPEDPRLFFTNDGQPLLIYSQTGRSPNICRALFVIDARVVIPGLSKALQKAGWNAPIRFAEQTDLIRENQFNIEKNWSPFLGENDELFFHVSLVPQQIYKYVPNLTLRPLDPLAPSHNCLTDVIGPDMNRVHLHHATPLLRATLCARGECKPDVHNTVLMGMIHVKYHPLPYLHYVRRLVTWNVTSPYEYLSVSKPLTFSGTNQADPIFTVSMAWDHPTDRHGLGLNHGFLDDTVLISFGVADYGSGYTDVLARDLLTDHELCGGVGGTSLWPSSS